MANTKKPSGLGRGLGDLLDDNTPDIREGRSKVTVKTEPTSTVIASSKSIAV